MIMKGDGETACFDVSIETTSSSSSCERAKAYQEMQSNASSTSNEEAAINCKRRLCSFLSMFNKIFIREIMAEAVGTYILVFCICGIISNMQLMGVQVGLLEYAATASLTVVVVVFSIGPISGAHINPSVTLAFASLGPFPWPKVPFYIMAQVGGSVFATISSRLIYGVEYEHMMTRPLHGCNAAFWVEFLATFLILFLAASMSSDPQFTGKLAGFVVGVCIGLGVLISGPVSGGSMNPARSLGPAIASWSFDSNLWIYVVAPTTGAVAGVFLYRLLRLQGWTCKHADTSPNTPLHNNYNNP
ncbi:probable aquaporin NIP7-1, partial [Ipomoea triloba]|uniref:probable aquaporin NIP7-1 n=1 Tax=Ipomoea triloba TaxID=35885 RepID=UPI00125D2226